jgi:putative hydrolases of HD superfamily
MNNQRLEKQLGFILEIDKLKKVERQTLLTDGSRLENSAEHSWNIALMALVLSEYAAEADMDFCRVVKMLLVHDLVEIDAGDTYCYDEKKIVDQAERENRAADRIFGMLSEDQATGYLRLWEEFEAKETPESRFANAIDSMHPLLHNYRTNGRIWRQNKIRTDQVVKRTGHIKETAPVLWERVAEIIGDAAKQGMLKE